MAETIQTFLARVKEAALLLGEPETINLITAVQQQTGAARLRILIVGSPGSGRFSLANVILGQMGLLPASPIPRAPLPIHIGYGEASNIEVTDQEGITSFLPVSNLRAFLTNPDTDASTYPGLNIQANSVLLRASELRIETIGARCTVGEWKELLANTDYVLLVLNAIALLGEHERRFIRDILCPAFGLERVAIIVNQIDLVAADEQASIGEQVRAFLGRFESQPLLLETSAVQAGEGLASGNIPASSGYDVLMRLVQEDLLGRQRTIKVAALRQAAELCLAELEANVQHRQSLLSTSETDLKKLLDQLDPQSQWLQTRTERSQHRIEAFVNILIKEQTMRDIEAFNSVLREQLPREIMSIREVKTIKRHLPGYIESLWNDFFTYQMPQIRNRLIDEMQQISDSVVADLQELVAQQPASFQGALGSFNPVPASMKAFIMPARGHHPAGTAATWMQAGGLGLLLLMPQVGLVLFGVGQIMRVAFHYDIVAADKQAVVASVLNATQDMEKQIKRQVENHFQSLAEQLKQTVADLYTQGITSMRTALEADIKRYQEVAAQRGQLETLANETLPTLRQTLKGLLGGKA